MEANLHTFRHLRKELRATLFRSYGEPLSCELHELLPIDAETDASYGIPIDNQHSALACNIASVIVSIERLLSSPKSNIGCRELFEILVLRLDVLREYVFEALNVRLENESLAEKKSVHGLAF